MYLFCFAMFCSSVKLNDPGFMRKNHAILCFKKLDASLTGRIDRAAFQVLFAMLLQNELIGSKSNLNSALARLDPEGEDKIEYGAFLNWISLVSIGHVAACAQKQLVVFSHVCSFPFVLCFTGGLRGFQTKELVYLYIFAPDMFQPCNLLRCTFHVMCNFQI